MAAPAFGKMLFGTFSAVHKVFLFRLELYADKELFADAAGHYVNILVSFDSGCDVDCLRKRTGRYYLFLEIPVFLIACFMIFSQDTPSIIENLGGEECVF